ncbi:MAG: T9SS type A sorting domain-containing protein [Rhodothermales bacterium]|nr:T9SS type A sorting domain-containing protein [Rhodothermales bacterium]
MFAKRATTKPAAVPLAIFVLLSILAAPAVVTTDARAQSQRIQAGSVSPDLDAVARARIEATIRANRDAKAASAPSLGKRRLAPAPSVSASRLDVVYTAPYVDTDPAVVFSFPDEAHDFCKAEFDPSADQDYTLASSLLAGNTLTVDLAWASEDGTVTDFDLYLFDRNGQVVGDPAGLLPDGAVGDLSQLAGAPAAEQAFATATSDEPVYAVIDRFRGTGAASLTLTFSGDDGAFSVDEYVGADFFTHIDAVADAIVGALTEGAALDLDSVGSPRPNFNAALNTDGCARSVSFILINQATGDTVSVSVDDLKPFAALGDTDGDFTPFDLAGGAYILEAVPYAGPGGTGAAGDSAVVAFTVVGAPLNPAVGGFTLIDADTDLPIPGFDPIADGAVLDLTELPLNLALRANTIDPDGVIGSVTLALARSDGGATGGAAATDDDAPYSLYGDAGGDFAPGTLEVGAYTLAGTPFAGAGGQGEAFQGATIAFTVIGPRIESYTLINATTEEVVPGFDPIPEGSELNLAVLPGALNIRANTRDPRDILESVKFVLTVDGTMVRTSTERARPYSLYGDFNQAVQGNDTSIDVDPPNIPNYGVWPAPLNGVYSLLGTPYDNDTPSAGRAYGPLTLSFTIVNSPAGSAPPPRVLTNYPNPFNPTTTIRFALADAQSIRLRVFDAVGREVRVLIDGALEAGVYDVEFQAGDLASGLYLYRLETEAGVQVRPMILMK